MSDDTESSIDRDCGVHHGPGPSLSLAADPPVASNSATTTIARPTTVSGPSRRAEQRPRGQSRDRRDDEQVAAGAGRPAPADQREQQRAAHPRRRPRRARRTTRRRSPVSGRPTSPSSGAQTASTAQPAATSTAATAAGPASGLTRPWRVVPTREAGEAEQCPQQGRHARRTPDPVREGDHDTDHAQADAEPLRAQPLPPGDRADRRDHQRRRAGDQRGGAGGQPVGHRRVEGAELHREHRDADPEQGQRLPPARPALAADHGDDREQGGRDREAPHRHRQGRHRPVAIDPTR